VPWKRNDRESWVLIKGEVAIWMVSRRYPLKKMTLGILYFSTFLVGEYKGLKISNPLFPYYLEFEPNLG
jgi:hypothetical protein